METRGRNYSYIPTPRSEFDQEEEEDDELETSSMAPTENGLRTQLALPVRITPRCSEAATSGATMLQARALGREVRLASGTWLWAVSRHPLASSREQEWRRRRLQRGVQVQSRGVQSGSCFSTSRVPSLRLMRRPNFRRPCIAGSRSRGRGRWGRTGPGSGRPGYA